MIKKNLPQFNRKYFWMIPIKNHKMKYIIKIQFKRKKSKVKLIDIPNLTKKSKL